MVVDRGLLLYILYMHIFISVESVEGRGQVAKYVLD